MITIDICLIDNFPSVKEGIFYFTKCSGQKLKKSGISKNYLERKLTQREVLSIPIDLMNHNKINPCYQGEVIDIRETEKFLIISKPSKIHCHPLKYSENNNILSFLTSTKYSKFLDVNHKNYDRGLLYRLDYETSGLILYAKNIDDHKKIRKDFSKLVKRKIYLALVEGNCQSQNKVIHYLKDSGKKNSKVIAMDDEQLNTRQAMISIKQLNYKEDHNISLIEVSLNEGHRHQIRVQLKAINHAIIGDPLYSNITGKRLYLHCSEYEIELSEKRFKFEDPNREQFLEFFNFNSEL